MKQDRHIMITNKAIYNLKKKELKRRIDLSTLKGITASKQSEEFIVHGNDMEYDYHYISPRRKIIVKSCSIAFWEMNRKEMPFCEFDSASLKNIVTSKTEKKKDLSFSRMPTEGLMPVNNWLYGSVEKSVEVKENPRSGTIYSKKKEIKEVSLEQFKAIKVLGRGSFGKVSLVEYIPTRELYALKSMKKDVLIDQDQVSNTLMEKKILETLEHPFLVDLVFCFQTNDRLYFAMPFMHGGELFQHLKNFRIFEEEKAKFYAAQIGLALEHLHTYGIIYRDIKPEV